MRIRHLSAIAGLAAMSISALACDSSLTKTSEDPLADLDGGTQAEFTVYNDESDLRVLPYQCEAKEDCDDNDVCTNAACTRTRCAYTTRNIQLEPVYIDTGEPAVDVSIHGARLFVAMGIGGVEVYDISDPEDPDQEGTATTEGEAVAVEGVSGGMFVSQDDVGVAFFSTPTLERAYIRRPDGGWVRGLDQINGVDQGSRYSFVSGFNDGFTIIDLADISAPQLVDGFNTSGRVHRVASDNEIAVVADALGGVVIYAFDLENGIDRISSLATDGRVVDADLKGGSLFMAEYGEGFSLVDVSDMTDPRRLVDITSATPAVAARLIGPQTAVAGQENGQLLVYDVSLNVTRDKKDEDGVLVPVAVPTAPTLINSVELEGEILGIDVEGGMIAVALGEAGAALIDTGCSAE